MKADKHFPGVIAVSVQPGSKDPMTQDQKADEITKPVSVARQVTITAISETVVLVTCDEADIICVDTHPLFNGQRSALIAEQIAEVMTQEPFHIRVSNFAEEWKHFPKSMIVPQES